MNYYKTAFVVGWSFPLHTQFYTLNHELASFYLKEDRDD